MRTPTNVDLAQPRRMLVETSLSLSLTLFLSLSLSLSLQTATVITELMHISRRASAAQSEIQLNAFHEAFKDVLRVLADWCKIPSFIFVVVVAGEFQTVWYQSSAEQSQGELHI